MTLKRLITPAAMALAITMATMPALAQSGGNEKQKRFQDRSAVRAESGSQDRGARGDVAERRSAPRENSAPANRIEERSRPLEIGASSARQDANRGSGDRQEANRGSSARQDANRGSSARQDANRGSAVRRNDNRGNDARSNNNRGYDARRDDNRGYDARGYSGQGYDGRGYSGRGYDGRGYSSRDYGWRGSYDRNAWRSRLRFGLGLSIFAGRPFGFRFDYGWRPGFNYRYPIRQGTSYGGMSFLLNPDDAEVYIDGNFVGIARDFGGQPVPVAVGYHRIELYAQGFEPVAFDINVMPGQVIPYRGSLNQVY